MYVAVRQLKHYSWAALLTATAVGCLVWAQPHANLTTTELVLVLVVTVSAIAWGSGPALITALLSVSVSTISSSLRFTRLPSPSHRTGSHSWYLWLPQSRSDSFLRGRATGRRRRRRAESRLNAYTGS